MARRKKAVSLSNAADQIYSRLLGLPAELRNRIYQMAFSDETVKIPSRSETNTKGLYKTPGLPLACKQIYAEVISFFYAESIFEVEKKNRLFKWRNKVGPVRQQQLNAIHYASKVLLYCEITQSGLLSQACTVTKYRTLALKDLRSTGILVNDEAFDIQFKLYHGPIFWTHEPKAFAKKLVQRLKEIKKNNPKIKHQDAWDEMIEHLAADAV